MADKTNTNAANNTTSTKAKVNLYADMRVALVKAHNDGNKKAIDRQRIADLEVKSESFTTWTARCKLLRDTTFDYVAKRKANRYGDKKVTAAMVKEAREKIYPMWKELLSYGEKSEYDKELKCCESDVEDIVGFVWQFYDTGVGTAECCVKETMFRKKIESLLGCIIAKNAVLSDEDRETLSKYQKAIRRQAQAQDTIDNLEDKVKDLELVLGGIPEGAASDPFRDYINGQIKAVKADIKAAEDKMANAKVDEQTMEKKAKAVQAKMKLAK